MTVVWKVSLVAELVAAFAVYFIVVARGRLGRGPQDYFLAFFGPQAAVTFVIADVSTQWPWMVFVSVAMNLFIVGCWAISTVAGFDHGKELDRFVRQPWIVDLSGLRFAGVLFLTALSIGIGCLFLIKAHAFVPAQALAAYLETGNLAESMKVYYELRLAIHAGTRGYLAPGYAMQFVNVILPAMSILLISRARFRPGYSAKALAGGVALITLALSLGSGRRAPLIIYLLTILAIFSWRRLSPVHLRRSQLAMVGAVMLVLFSVVSGLMARGMVVQEGLAQRIAGGPMALLDRLFVLVPRFMLSAYDFMLAGSSGVWGSGWLEELKGVLPGTQLDLSNQLHQILLAGGPDGNAPLNIWGQNWYNLGPILGAAAFLFYGGFCQAYYIWLLRGPKAVSRIMILLIAATIIGVAQSPFEFILKGGLTLHLLIVILMVLPVRDGERTRQGARWVAVGRRVRCAEPGGGTRGV